MRLRRFRTLPLLPWALLASATATADPLGTAFTYQGQLAESGQPASGLYDLQVCLFDAPSNPLPLACAPDFGDVPVDRGVFTLALDFGAAPFTGQQRFIELRVRPGASTAGYTILAPRQLVRAAPEALRAAAASAAPWSGLTGVPAGLADGIDDNSGGTVTSITAGSGLSGGTITGSGTIGIANGGVGSAQLADGGVAAVDVATDSLGAGQIASNGVAAAELADNAVDTAAVQNLAISQAKLANGAVGSAQIAAGAVGAAQIDPAQVQARIGGTCAIGEYFRGVNADGTVACEPVPGVSRITTVDYQADGGVVGRHTSIAIGSDGLPVVSYQDVIAGTLKVARCGNSACTIGNTITTVDDPATSVGRHTSIAIGADGLPVVSYHDETNGALKVAKCGNASCSSGNTITTVDDPSSNVGVSTDIAIGVDGLPVISYHDQTNGTLKVAKCGNAACTSGNTIATVDDPANFVGATSSIAIGTDGFPVISYFDNSAFALRVAKCGNATCTSGNVITFVDALANNVGLGTSIAIGAGGRPVISYYDLTATALRVAACGNAACTSANTITTVDNTGSVGSANSIAIGTDGLPVVAYHDLTANAVKVAKCGNDACTNGNTITTVDDPTNLVGSFVSMAIGIDGLPVMSYSDSSAASLKVAKCGTRSCQ